MSRCAQRFGQLQPVHAGHIVIGQNEIDGAVHPRQRGIAGETAAEAIDERLEGRNAADDAFAVAEKAARLLPRRADAMARKRRLMNAMARRGFDYDACRTALERMERERPELFADEDADADANG
jgi:hypothetical protein